MSDEAAGAGPRYRCHQHEDRRIAYATVVGMLRSVAPFSGYKFGTFSTVLLGQIVRRHYVITYQLPEKKPVGYFGWALCDEEVARAWIEEGYVPTQEQCTNGSCFVVATFHAVNPQVTRFQTAYVRRLYPNIKVFGRRDYVRREDGLRLRPMAIRNRVEEESA